MTRALVLLSAVGVLAVAAVAALPAAAAGSGPGAAFKIRAAYDATPTPDLTCGGFRVVGSGSAVGTDIGAGTWNDTECANFLARPSYILISGNLTLTAPNGDEIFIDYQTTTLLPDSTGAIHPRGTFTIVGGTGRFAGATGSGDLAAEANVVHPATTATLDGVIDLR